MANTHPWSTNSANERRKGRPVGYRVTEHGRGYNADRRHARQCASLPRSGSYVVAVGKSRGDAGRGISEMRARRVVV
jgi:hypothetical protein